MRGSLLAATGTFEVVSSKGLWLSGQILFVCQRRPLLR